MKVCDHVYQLKIDFNVTPEVERYVYVYIIEGNQGYYLIDSGVKGSDKKIKEAIHKIGKRRENINTILLTHSHPDHMGAVKAIKSEYHCALLASGMEKCWIENIDIQYRDRPIPGFYNLVEGSSTVDQAVGDGDTICLDPGITVQVIGTPGHSSGSVSYYFEEMNVLFTGDAIPDPGDVMIFEDSLASEMTLRRLAGLAGVNYYCPAWDRVYTSKDGKEVIQTGLKQIQNIRACMNEYLVRTRDIHGLDIQNAFTSICERCGATKYRENPMFKRSVIEELTRIYNHS